MKQQLTSDNINRTLSKKAAETIQPIPKECWKNATLALVALPELSRAHYIEGWSVLAEIPVPFEHAWLELDGQIIDPTPAMWKGHQTYFPGLRLTKDELLQALNEDSSLPIVWRSEWGGMRHPDFLEAYIAAWGGVVSLTPDIREKLSKKTKPLLPPKR
jgi:hypothetical protein